MKYGKQSLGLWDSHLEKHFQDWENSEYLPKKIGRYDILCNAFKYPVKLVPLPLNLRDPSWCYEALAVRSDAYPLLWVLVMWNLAIGSLFARLRPAYWMFFRWANNVGIMRTKVNSIPSHKDLWFLEGKK